jgi:hypothetical protein
MVWKESTVTPMDGMSWGEILAWAVPCLGAGGVVTEDEPPEQQPTNRTSMQDTKQFGLKPETSWKCPPQVRTLLEISL